MDDLNDAIAEWNSHVLSGDGCFTCRAAVRLIATDIEIVHPCPDGSAILADIEQAAANLRG